MNLLNKTRFRFRLLSLLVLVGLLAISFATIKLQLDSQPIPWVEYTAKAFEQQARESSPIVVFLNVEWDLNGCLVKQTAFEDQDLKRVFHQRSIVAFYADVNGASPDALSLLNRIGRHSTPIVLVYTKGGYSDPIVLDELVTAEQILTALETVPAVMAPIIGG